MAAGRSKRLSINLSFLNFTDHYCAKAQKSPTKSFEEPNGVVGLGILAAMTDVHHPDPIRILRNKSVSENSTGKKDGMELCEEYTCVISHVGDSLMEKREYFDSTGIGGTGLGKLSDSDSAVRCSGGREIAVFAIADFLNSCFLCDKMLHGLDIFMYSGEKAFCSAECRHRQISIDEKKEKRRSAGMRKQRREYSVSPCSGALHFLAGVAAA